jgi:hypothetical protein
MDKTPWAAFMESKDKFHNLEFMAAFNNQNPRRRRDRPRRTTRKGLVAEARFRVNRVKLEPFDPASPAQSIFGDGLSRGAPLLQARFRRPILSDKPNSALVEQRP